MKITVNGKQEQLEVQTVEDIVAHYALQEKPIVVEADGIVLKREQWATTLVREDSKIELVHFVGGG
ncbi:sulfur carrier protein ThiS [Paenibacillus soyae]|uniref:Sulfur carrier protein ThiS n=1 Tax=Paenibacillus soyae TaxID=2969249 RepID=A0A9X2MPJ0_9BACL|nr:sulfur carrier protein ThiS [Paenibacillus soyae]MCR2803867.1 sulfur carrier protein ThiS [Paenibacillus soyae]